MVFVRKPWRKLAEQMGARENVEAVKRRLDALAERRNRSCTRETLRSRRGDPPSCTSDHPLYRVREKRGWSRKAQGYNALVLGWSELVRLAQEAATGPSLAAGEAW